MLGRRIAGLLALLLLIASYSASASAIAGGSVSRQAIPAANAGTSASAPVAVIPIHQAIESGLESFLDRAFREAERSGARWIVLDINTLGGSIGDAETIGELIRQSPIETVAFVHGKAASAGSYLALNANKIILSPGSSIGAAAVVDAAGNHVTDPKIIAHWSSEMASAAEMNGRNAKIAEGMVDESLVVPMPAIGRTKSAGEIISLTADEAVKVGYAEAVERDIPGVLQFLHAGGHPLLHIEPTPAERLARFLVQPWVMTLLLLVGIAGLAIELLMPGVTLPGAIGVIAFGLYFFGHYIAGFAGIEDIVLFVLGVGLMITEIFVPSFGLIGISGIVCLVLGVVLAAYSTTRALESLGIAVLADAVIVAIAARIFKHKGIWNRFILNYQLTDDLGYLSAPDRRGLLGQTGISLSPLRPSGKVRIGEERVDAVTDGEFIPAGSPVIVSRIEGSRLIVREDRKA